MLVRKLAALILGGLARRLAIELRSELVFSTTASAGPRRRPRARGRRAPRTACGGSRKPTSRSSTFPARLRRSWARPEGAERPEDPQGCWREHVCQDARSRRGDNYICMHRISCFFCDRLGGRDGNGSGSPRGHRPHCTKKGAVRRRAMTKDTPPRSAEGGRSSKAMPAPGEIRVNREGAPGAPGRARSTWLRSCGGSHRDRRCAWGLSRRPRGGRRSRRGRDRRGRRRDAARACRPRCRERGCCTSSSPMRRKRMSSMLKLDMGRPPRWSARGGAREAPGPRARC